MYRYGDQSSNLADLITISENLHESINIGFKYIDNKSCTLGEAGVNGYKGCILKKLASENWFVLLHQQLILEKQEYILVQFQMSI